VVAAMTDRQRFERLIGAVLEHEGGLADDPDDPGGITKYGISLRSYPHLGRDGIRNLTIPQAKDIYYGDWWLRLRCGEIQDDRIAQKYLDMSVNVGKTAGIKIMQRALREAGQSVAVDGKIGPQTIGAANKANPDALLAAMRRLQAEHYESLIRRNPKLAKFRRGWMARAAF
jgi:lysozyme family protein